MKTELLFATHNRGKASEIERMTADKYSLLTLDDAGITADIPETADTLQGNALIKARFLHNLTGKACFADDTGLEVEALDGAPGVTTARYAGPECDPNRNMDKLLNALDGKPNRAAQFRTVIAFIDADGAETLFQGICRGSIATERHGDAGFGFDPIFAPDGHDGLTFAQMSIDDKNKISHRGQAVRALAQFLNDKK